MAIDGSSHRWGRVCVAATLLGALVGAAIPAAGQPPPAEPAVRHEVGGAADPPSIEWQSCGEDFPAHHCATVTVPLDHDRPSAGTTQLAVARFPAADTEHRIGSLFVNPGGPGGSAVAMVLSMGEVLGGQLEGRFDIVGFDPRGVGASDPLRCFGSEEELDEFLAGQPIFPHREDQYRPFFAASTGLAADCLEAGPPVTRHMSTANVARDMDLLRRAVGDPKLSYLGFSYGSFLGNTYANLFPDKVRALAIDGVLDPNLWSTGWQVRSDRVATQEVFDEFLRLCDEARGECAFWTPEGAERRWERFAASIRHAPLQLPDGFVYPYDYLVGDTTGVMYAPEIWAEAAAYFDALADAALADDPAAAADLRGLRTELVERLTGSAREPDYPNGFEAYFGNHCADAEYPDSFHRWLGVAKYAGQGSPFGPYWWWYNAPCAEWPVDPDRYTGPWTARTSAPVLVVGNYFDGVTDYAGARATDRLLPNSRLLGYAGWGHTAHGRSQCATDYINDYLLTTTLPPEGEVCPANPNPFLTAGARVAGATPSAGLPPAWLVRPNLPEG